MCDPVTASVIAVGAAAGGAIFGANEARDARKSAEREQRRVRTAAEQEQARIEQRETNAATVADQAARRRRQAGNAGTGRSGTILTGPMGVLGTDTSRPMSTILGG